MASSLTTVRRGGGATVAPRRADSRTPKIEPRTGRISPSTRTHPRAASAPAPPSLLRAALSHPEEQSSASVSHGDDTNASNASVLEILAVSQKAGQWAEEMGKLMRRQGDLERLVEERGRRLREWEQLDGERRQEQHTLRAQVALLQSQLARMPPPEAPTAAGSIERERLRLDHPRRGPSSEASHGTPSPPADAIKTREKSLPEGDRHPVKLPVPLLEGDRRAVNKLQAELHRQERIHRAAQEEKDKELRTMKAQMKELKASRNALQTRLGEVLHSYIDVMDERVSEDGRKGRSRGPSPSHSARTPSRQRPSYPGLEVLDGQQLGGQEVALREEVARLQARVAHLQKQSEAAGSGLATETLAPVPPDEAPHLRQELLRRTQALDQATKHAQCLEVQVQNLQKATEEQAEETERLAQRLQQLYAGKFVQLQCGLDSASVRADQERREAEATRLHLHGVITDLRALLQDAHHQLAAYALNRAPSSQADVPFTTPTRLLQVTSSTSSDNFELIYSRDASPTLVAAKSRSHSDPSSPPLPVQCSAPCLKTCHFDPPVEMIYTRPRASLPSFPAPDNRPPPSHQTTRSAPISPVAEFEMIYCRPPPRIEAVEEVPVRGFLPECESLPSPPIDDSLQKPFLQTSVPSPTYRAATVRSPITANRMTRPTAPTPTF